MKRLTVVALAAAFSGCFDFDGAYSAYCSRVSCDGGTSAGGTATAGGTTAGGSAGGVGGGSAGGVGGGNAGGLGGGNAGGMGGGNAGGLGGGSAGGMGGGSAGGLGGGSSGGDAGGTAGGSAGGSAGGAAGGASGGSAPTCSLPFCVHRQTQRTDHRDSAAVIGRGLDDVIALTSKLTTPREANWVTHGTSPTPSPGTARLFSLGLAPPLDEGNRTAGTPFDFVVITESSNTTAALRRVVDGGVVATPYSGTCAGQSLYASSFTRHGDRVYIGGSNDGLCEVDLATGQSFLLQPEGSAQPGSDVEDVLRIADGGLLWVTNDGFIGQLGLGRITAQIDTEGMVGLDVDATGQIWAVSKSGLVVKSVDDGGFVLDAVVEEGVAYDMTVTPDGVFVAGFGGIGYRTAFTDGGFEFFRLPINSNSRVYSITGAAGAIHVAGNEGPINSLTQTFFLTLIPRTQ